MSLQPLVVVQARRVDQAMAELKIRNELLRQKLAEREAAQARWEEAQAAYRKQQEDAVSSVAAHLNAGMAAVGLAAASRRGEWLREQAAELHTQLQAVETALSEVRAAVAEALHIYRRALAKQEALNTLAERARRERSVEVMRADEHAVDDLVANGFANEVMRG